MYDGIPPDLIASISWNQMSEDWFFRWFPSSSLLTTHYTADVLLHKTNWQIVKHHIFRPQMMGTCLEYIRSHHFLPDITLWGTYWQSRSIYRSLNMVKASFLPGIHFTIATRHCNASVMRPRFISSFCYWKMESIWTQGTLLWEISDRNAVTFCLIAVFFLQHISSSIKHQIRCRKKDRKLDSIAPSWVIERDKKREESGERETVTVHAKPQPVAWWEKWDGTVW